MHVVEGDTVILECVISDSVRNLVHLSLKINYRSLDGINLTIPCQKSQ